jgi:hypothetical protein
VAVLIAGVLGGTSVSVRAESLDKDTLKIGMTLPDVVEGFGQPLRVEWVNLKGQPVLFLFYPYDGFFDGLTQEDGRKIIPLGFVTEKLAGWGGKFYEQTKAPDR